MIRARYTIIIEDGADGGINCQYESVPPVPFSMPDRQTLAQRVGDDVYRQVVYLAGATEFYAGRMQ